MAVIDAIVALLVFVVVVVGVVVGGVALVPKSTLQLYPDKSLRGRQAPPPHLVY